MNPIPSSSVQLPVNPQASSPNTASSDGCRVTEQQESLSRLNITDDQPGAASTPSPVNITDRSASIPARPVTYDYVLPFDGKTYKVTTEQFTHEDDDGSCGLKLVLENGDEFIKCSKPLSSFARPDRQYFNPDYDEDRHIAKLMLIKDYSINEGCLDFLTRNRIVKVVGHVETAFVDFPIVQLIENKKSRNKNSAAGVDSLSSLVDAFAGKNLVASSKKLQTFLLQGMYSKEVPTKSEMKILNKYVAERKLSVLEKTSFKHIAIYMDFGTKTERLDIACSDFGFTLQELKQLRREKKNSFDVASEVTSRK